MAQRPLAFEPAEPNLVGIEVQRLNAQHIVRRMGLHCHQFLEIVYFEQGGGRYRSGDRVWDVRPGDLFLTAPGEVHDATALEGAAGWIVLFTADAVNPTDPDASSYLNWFSSPLFFPFVRGVEESGYFQISVEGRSLWSERLQALAEELQTQPLGYEEVARAYLTQILVSITRLATQSFNRFPLRKQSLITEVFNFIELHYQEPISLSDIATALNHAPTYLASSIRELTGRTVLEWIRERRMAEARRRLLDTEEDIAQIAEQLGYANTTYFIRQFRQVHRQTPLAWRRTHR